MSLLGNQSQTSDRCSKESTPPADQADNEVPSYPTLLESPLFKRYSTARQLYHSSAAQRVSSEQLARSKQAKPAHCSMCPQLFSAVTAITV